MDFSHSKDFSIAALERPLVSVEWWSINKLYKNETDYSWDIWDWDINYAQNPEFFPLKTSDQRFLEEAAWAIVLVVCALVQWRDGLSLRMWTAKTGWDSSLRGQRWCHTIGCKSQCTRAACPWSFGRQRDSESGDETCYESLVAWSHRWATQWQIPRPNDTQWQTRTTAARNGVNGGIPTPVGSDQ